ncbi:hypothetical protein ACSSVZ_004303 [Amorphus sp. MBR-141]
MTNATVVQDAILETKIRGSHGTAVDFRGIPSGIG